MVYFSSLVTFVDNHYIDTMVSPYRAVQFIILNQYIHYMRVRGLEQWKMYMVILPGVATAHPCLG